MPRQLRNNVTHFIVRTAVVGVVLFAAIPVAHATGNIAPGYKYAWGNIAGWINFAPTNGGITVSTSGITGYAWAGNTGWINFSATNGGVTNTADGTLGGYAWDEGGGWISFTGVTIDANGRFHGTAIGGTVQGASYRINFDCSLCNVTTTWVPTAATVSNTPAVSTASGGGGRRSTAVPAEAVSTAGPALAAAASPARVATGGKTQTVRQPVPSVAKPAAKGVWSTILSKTNAVVRAAAIPVSIVSLFAFLLFLLL
jgi:hypothetical protein